MFVVFICLRRRKARASMACKRSSSAQQTHRKRERERERERGRGRGREGGREGGTEGGTNDLSFCIINWTSLSGPFKRAKIKRPVGDDQSDSVLFEPRNDSTAPGWLPCRRSRPLQCPWVTHTPWKHTHSPLTHAAGTPPLTSILSYLSRVNIQGFYPSNER